MLREFAAVLLKRGSAIAVAVTLATLAGKASALAYVGEYDPDFVTSFTGNSWSGQVTFEVPDACIPTGSGTVTKNILQQNCGGMKFLGATVVIRDEDDAILDTLVFPASYFTGSLLTQVRFTNGLPVGVNGLFYAPVFTEEVVADDSDSGTAFWLAFKDFVPVLKWAYLKCEEEDHDCHSNRFSEVSRSFEQIDEECRVVFGVTPTSGDGAAEWTNFYVVPEPGSLALLLSALGVLGFVRSRKDRAAKALA